MNAAQENTLPLPATPSLEDADCPQSALSALVDGEIRAEADWAHCLGTAPAAGEAEDAWAARWARYHLIGDALRGTDSVLCAQPPADFLAGVRARLAAEAAPGVQAPLAARPSAPVPEAIAPVRGPAANDALFRWKLVAGFASLAAVMAVSWSLLGTAPGSPASAPAGAQLASAAGPSVAGAPAPAGSAVVVNTPHGPVIRDAQLEARLAEHRQYGGMSALQMPAGFLRNATYDAPGR
jgi:sigma-E factor negative regulatory protein RseA